MCVELIRGVFPKTLGSQSRASILLASGGIDKQDACPTLPAHRCWIYVSPPTAPSALGRATALRRITAAILLAVALLSANAQVAPRAYRESIWLAEDGLPDDAVTTCLQTRDGYIWIGTEKGLARFDGVTFREFNTWNTKELHSDRISALTEDALGTLWIGTKGGGVTHCRDGEFRHAGLSSQFVNTLCTSRDGRVWVGTSGGGLFAFHEGEVSSYTAGHGLPDLFIRALVEGRDGTLWIGTRDAGLVAMRNGGFESIPVGDRAAPGPVTALHEDAAGGLWIGTPSGLFFRGTNGFARLTTAHGLPSNYVLAVTQDAFSRLWVGTEVGAVHVQGAGASGFAVSAVEVRDAVAAILSDAEGNVWMAGPRAGLRKLTPTKIARLTRRDGLSHEAVNGVYEDSVGRIWFSTSGALYRLERGVLSKFDETSGLVHPVVTAIHEDDAGVLWIGTQQGMNRLDNGGLQPCPVEQGWPSGGVWGFHEDRTGILWIATADGLLGRTEAGVTRYTVDDGLPANDVRALAEDAQGRLWIGTSHGLAFRSGDVFDAVALPPGLLTRIVLAMYVQADGTVWCGTLGGGLLKYSDGQAIAYTTREGLPDNTIYGIVDDGIGSFWLSSNRGLFRVAVEDLDRAAAEPTSDLPMQVFGVHDGLPSESCRGFGQSAGCRTRDGRLWFSTDKGVAVVDPRLLSGREREPPVVIDRFVVDGRSIDPRGPVELRPDGEQYEFQFAGLSFADPKRVRFKYRLEGFDEDWVEAGERRSAYYTRLPPGSYRFFVTARNADGRWNPDGASMPLAIVPHFWQTWWFLWGSALAAVAAIAGISLRVSTVKLNRRLRQLEREQALERERTRIARDLHDAVGANLTRIGRLSEMAERRKDDTPAVVPILLNIREATGDVVQAMDEIVWTVDPANDSLENMANYLVHYTEEFMRNTGIAYQLDVPVMLPDVTLSAEVRHNLFMAVKEAISNAVRHARARSVRVKLTAVGGLLTVSVTDDGVGFTQADKKPTSSGVDNMNNRMAAIGGKWHVERDSEHGTTVTMTLGYGE